MLKHSEDRIVRNRTITIIGDQKPFVVLATDRDYEDDPTGQSQTIVFRGTYDSIDDAEREMESQRELALTEGFVLNPWAHGGLPPV
jgi:hypothetical protein